MKKQSDIIHIERVKEEDLEKIISIERATFLTPWSFEIFHKSLAGYDNIFLVAKHMDDVVGYTVGLKICDELHIANLAVEKEKRRRGIGEKLLNKLLNWENGWEWKIATLEVRASNISAQNLYRKFGFEEVAIRKKYYGSEDGIVMLLKKDIWIQNKEELEGCKEISDKIILRVDSLAQGGDGVGRIEKRVVFVRDGVPGDRVLVKVRDVKRNYIKGDIVEIFTPSQLRVKPQCDEFGRCGGCQWQMMDYNAQLKTKREILRDTLERIGGIKEPLVEKVLGMHEPFRFRNKAQYPLSDDCGIKIGYYRRGSHELVDIKKCIIQYESLDEALGIIRKILHGSSISIYDEKTGNGLLRHILLRYSNYDKNGLLILVTNGRYNIKDIAEKMMSQIPSLVGVLQNVNIRRDNIILGEEFHLLTGRDYLIERICGLKLKISAGSFFQVNSKQTEVLYGKVREIAGLSKSDLVLDVYCGVGGIGLLLAMDGGLVIGIEEAKSSVDDARENARLNFIENYRVICGRAEEKLQDIEEADVVVLDPPREGCKIEVLKQVIRLNPDRIIYISCNPGTLARDASVLIKSNYYLVRVYPVDLFPHSFHIESISLFEKIDWR